MLCYQVLAQFTFYQHKAALVSTHIKKQNTRSFLVRSGLLFGHGLKVRRFFKTKKEAACYVSYLRRIYKNRIVPYPALPGGQQYLFQEVSK
jgi:catabolite regulation protein CreA